MGVGVVTTVTPWQLGSVLGATVTDTSRWVPSPSTTETVQLVVTAPIEQKASGPASSQLAMPLAHVVVTA